MTTPAFSTARPAWPEGRERDVNLFVGFRAVVEIPAASNAVLQIAASSLYRAFVNGAFLGHGPARGPHGHFRVDVWDLPPGTSVIAIEVAGYNVNSYYVLDQPSFLQAQVTAGGIVLASTMGEGAPFEAAILEEHLRKVQRYSVQRSFSECYRCRPGFDGWRRDAAAAFATVRCAEQPRKNLLPRRVPYPAFTERVPVREISRGGLENSVPDKLWKDRSLTSIGPTAAGFTEDELELIPSIELQHFRNGSSETLDRTMQADTVIEMGSHTFHILDFGINLTGFAGTTVHARTKVRLFLVFDEILSDGDVDFKRLACVNILTFELAPGTYVLESFEPYTFRYVKLLVLEGSCAVEGICLREMANPDVYRAQFSASDPVLNRLFEAGRETLRQNALDLFMDCPSRERAGWLCDSFFTARAAHDLCPDTSIERNHFENYLLPARFEHLPDGMLPKCYPADHYHGGFLPNWAMWFVIELEEYLARSGDRVMADALQPRVLKLLDYFRKFRNTDGLLERLDGGVFIEWSMANQFTKDVNYPTNMTYAETLAAAGRLYDSPALLEEAEKVRQAVRGQSFDGTFFVDNAVRERRRLKITTNRTEACQYYAFYFGTATPESHPVLWNLLRDRFGPRRRETGEHPEIHKANSFVGNSLRLELLSRYGLCRQLLDESKDYLLHMADLTGTLWEHDSERASCNHGFASHAVHVLYRDVLGIYRIDPGQRVVTIRFSDVPLDNCEGRVPVGAEAVDLCWWREGGRTCYEVSVPAGYSVQVENPGGL